MRKAIITLLFCIFLAPGAALSAGTDLTVKAVRYASYPAFTRVVFELEAAAPHVLKKETDGPNLLITGLDGTIIVKTPLPAVYDDVVNGVETMDRGGKNVLVVHLSAAAGHTKDFVLQEPDRLVLDISRGGVPANLGFPAGKPVVIVLDPGHGGKDTGIGAAQGYEKTATLDVARAVKDILRKEKGTSVVLTRNEDRDLSLDERAVISNKAGAAVFVSLHAAPGTGVMVFTPDLTNAAPTSSPPSAGSDFLGFEARLEQREKAWGSQQAAHGRESGDLARILIRRLGTPESPQAAPVPVPLAELKAVDAAAVMVEFGLGEEREHVAEAVAEGIEQYVRADR